MVNQIINVLSGRLYSLFDYKVEREESGQGVTPPCFMILSLSIVAKQLLGTHKYLTHPFDILYFPASEDEPRAEIHQVHRRLLEEMEYIQLPYGGILRGTELRCEIVDGVGHFLVDYNMTVRKPVTDPTMENLDLTEHYKE